MDGDDWVLVIVTTFTIRLSVERELFVRLPLPVSKARTNLLKRWTMDVDISFNLLNIS